MRTKDPNRAPKADHVQGFKCDGCDNLHLALMDENDRFIATAVLTVEMLWGMLDIVEGPKPEAQLQ
jgi:hypothetical protein